MWHARVASYVPHERRARLNLDLSDIGNAKLFASQHKGSLRYFAARGQWLTWRGNRWEADSTGEIMRRAMSTADALQAIAWGAEFASDEADSEAAAEVASRQRKAALSWARYSRSHERLKAMTQLASNAPGIVVSPQDLDADPWLLNCANGVLDLRTGQLRSPEPGMLMTKLAGCEFIPDAVSQVWLDFVASLTGGDEALARYLQRALGYALYGAWAEKAFWFCYGPPDGGKSTLLAIVGSILGDYHVSADASTWMHGKGAQTRGDLVRLMGARLVTTSEVRAGARFDEEVVKKVTGGDTLTYRQVYEHDVSFQPTFSLWLAGNDRPGISSGDDGMWRRVQCVPCVHSVPREKQNPRLVDELTSEAHASGVLAWLVAGCLEWQRNGLGSCPAIDAETEAYKLAMNPLAEFADEWLELGGGADAFARVADVRQAYSIWCQDRREKFPLKAKAFGRALRALGAEGGDNATKVRDEGTTCTVWRNVRLTKPAY